MNLAFINAQILPPAIPAITAAQVVAETTTGKVRVAWAECVGAHHYLVYEGTTTEVYTKITEIDAAAGLCEYTSENYDDQDAVYFVVSAVGVNGVESATSDEATVTIDATVRITAEFTLTAPAAGVNAAVAAVDAADAYAVKSTAWADAAETALEIGQPFVAETKYFCTVVLECEGTHKFLEGVTIVLPAGIHAAEGTLNEDATELSIVCEYLALTTDAITFTLAAPVTGENAAAAAVAGGTNYEVVSTAWHNLLDVPTEIGEAFVGVVVYHAVVVIAAKENHRLAKPFADLSITLPATATLVSQTVDAIADENQITIEVSFPETGA